MLDSGSLAIHTNFKRPNLGSFNFDIITKTSDSINPVGWDTELNRGDNNYIHRGHIIGHSLFPDKNWQKDVEKKYFTQLRWSNKSSQNASIGRNLSYFEWFIENELKCDKDLIANYRVNLIYEKI